MHNYVLFLWGSVSDTILHISQQLSYWDLCKFIILDLIIIVKMKTKLFLSEISSINLKNICEECVRMHAFMSYILGKLRLLENMLKSVWAWCSIYLDVLLLAWFSSDPNMDKYWHTQ